MEHFAAKYDAKYEEFKKDEEELFRLLAEAEQDLKMGRGRPYEEVFDDIIRDIRNGTI